MCIIKKLSSISQLWRTAKIRIFQSGRSHLDPTWCKKKYQEYSAGYQTTNIYYRLIYFPTVSYMEVTYSSSPKF